MYVGQKKHKKIFGVLWRAPAGWYGSDECCKKVKSEFVKISGENTKIAESFKRAGLDEFVRALPTGQSGYLSLQGVNSRCMSLCQHPPLL